MILQFEEPDDEVFRKCETLAEMMRASKVTLVYTGAGISTAAEIPDYRGPNGVYTLAEQGKEIGGCGDIVGTNPTSSHMALKELCRAGVVRHILSQNCDGLHLRSGIPQRQLSEIHGNMHIEICTNCSRQYIRNFDVTAKSQFRRHGTSRHCVNCRQELVDTIVHFGEVGRAPWPLNWIGTTKLVEQADLIVCLGTSLAVLKEYEFLWPKPKAKTKLAVVNLQWTPKDRVADLKIHAKCDKVLVKIADLLGMPIRHYCRECDPVLNPRRSARGEELKDRMTDCNCHVRAPRVLLPEERKHQIPGWWTAGIKAQRKAAADAAADRDLIKEIKPEPTTQRRSSRSKIDQPTTSKSSSTTLRRSSRVASTASVSSAEAPEALSEEDVESDDEACEVLYKRLHPSRKRGSTSGRRPRGRPRGSTNRGSFIKNIKGFSPPRKRSREEKPSTSAIFDALKEEMKEEIPEFEEYGLRLPAQARGDSIYDFVPSPPDSDETQTNDTVVVETKMEFKSEEDAASCLQEALHQQSPSISHLTFGLQPRRVDMVTTTYQTTVINRVVTSFEFGSKALVTQESCDEVVHKDAIQFSCEESHEEDVASIVESLLSRVENLEPKLESMQPVIDMQPSTSHSSLSTEGLTLSSALLDQCAYLEKVKPYRIDALTRHRSMRASSVPSNPSYPVREHAARSCNPALEDHQYCSIPPTLQSAASSSSLPAADGHSSSSASLPPAPVAPAAPILPFIDPNDTRTVYEYILESYARRNRRS